VKDTDTRTTVVQEYKLEKLDPKDGMVLTRVKEGEAEKKDGGKQEEELDPATAFAPRGGVWVAGLSASLAVILGGLWVVRRNRRSEL
jgi:hypothetical protein